MECVQSRKIIGSTRGREAFSLGRGRTGPVRECPHCHPVFLSGTITRGSYSGKDFLLSLSIFILRLKELVLFLKIRNLRNTFNLQRHSVK